MRTLEDFACYLIHRKDNLWFAKNPSLQILFKFTPKNGETYERGVPVKISGNYEKRESLIPGSGHVYGISSDEEKVWAVYTLHNPQLIRQPEINHFIQIEVHRLPLQVNFLMGSRWVSRRTKRELILDGIHLHPEDVWQSRIDYVLVKGTRKTKLTLRLLVSDYQQR